MGDKWKRLLTSRKVWLGLVGVVAAVVTYSQGLITAEQLVDVILGLVAAVIVAIGVEDAGQRASGR